MEHKNFNVEQSFFWDLNIGDEFIFCYEYELTKENKYPERWNKYITSFVKTGQNSYSNRAGRIVFDTRKNGISFAKIEGYSYMNTPVYKILSSV